MHGGTPDGGFHTKGKRGFRKRETMMEIKRIDTYTDHRFSQKVLDQHGCFLIEGRPCEVEILSDFEAVVRGKDRNAYPQLMEQFRFYTPHISKFYDDCGKLIREYPAMPVFNIAIGEIQPSQFFVDEEKIAAIRRFIHHPQDIIIQVMLHNGSCISLDGHTRLYEAVLNGWNTVRAVEAAADQNILGFVEEAKRRNIHSPKDMKLVSHREYEEKWNRFCAEYFQRLE